MNLLAKIGPLARALALLVLPTLVACVGILEVGLRLKGRGPTSVTDDIFAPHGSAYRLRPNQTKVSHTPSFTCTIHTNALGFRDRAPGPRPLARPYLAWLGDSATFANGVGYEESFVGLFGALSESHGVDVVNLAVGGHHLAEQEELLADFMAAAPRRPDRAVIVFTPALLALFDKRHENLVLHGGYLFPRDRWVVPYALVLLNNASAAYGFLRDGVRAVQARFFPSAPRAAAGMLGLYARSHPSHSEEATRRMEQRISALDARIRAAGVEPVHVYLPTTVDLRIPELLALTGEDPERFDFDHYREALRRESERAGVKLVDLTDALRAEHAKGTPLGFAQDMHYNAVAHASIGRALYAALMPADARGGSPAARRAVAPGATSAAVQ
jgi:hypothetical protein